MEVTNGGEPGLASKRGADLSPSAATATIEVKKQKVENPEEVELKKISETLDEGEIVTTNTTNGGKVEEEQEAVSEGKVESERGEEDGDSNVKAVIDRKGKGILIEEGEDDEEDDEEDDSDDDDSSDGGNISENGDDSDFSDDPLAEVDLDNILPSRTRRRVVDPTVYLSNDVGGADEDSDDSDA